MTKEAEEILKAGARHNKWDKATLDKMLAALFELGAVCPYCENEGKHSRVAEKADKFSKASTHIVVPSDHPIAIAHEQLRGQINEADLAEFGLEDFPHITVKYGFADSDLEQVREIVEQHPPFTVTLGAGAIFSRPDFDVLYIQAESDCLRELNAQLTPIGDPPNYPEYNPHMTIAYLLPQRAGKYLSIDNFVGMQLEVRAIEFSNSENNVTQIELRGNDMPFNGTSYDEIINKLYEAWGKHSRKKYEEKFENDFYTYAVAYWDSRIAIYWDGEYYAVPYAVMQGEDIVFASKERWTEVEKLSVWVAKHAAFLERLEGDEEVVSEDSGDIVKAFLTGDSNFLKSVGETDDYWIVGNHIVLWGDENTRDAEGQLSDRKNADGSVGEWFTSETYFDSEYMRAGVLLMDIEHGREVTDRDVVVGFADAKSAIVTDKGLFMKRLLSKRSAYTRWLKEMYEKGIRFATSSEPVQGGVEKAANGLITQWPLKRDTVTFGPMEPRMFLDANTLEEMKASVGDNMPQPLYDACVKSGILKLEDEGQSEPYTAGADLDIVARKRLLAKAAGARAEIAAMATD